MLGQGFAYSSIGYFLMKTLILAIVECFLLGQGFVLLLYVETNLDYDGF